MIKQCLSLATSKQFQNYSYSSKINIRGLDILIIAINSIMTALPEKVQNIETRRRTRTTVTLALRNEDK
jgi:hypothetical protein